MYYICIYIYYIYYIYILYIYSLIIQTGCPLMSMQPSGLSQWLCPSGRSRVLCLGDAFVDGAIFQQLHYQL